MADIFHEVDEEVRRERLKKLWDKYGIVAVALAVLIVIGVGGWRGYQYYETKKAQEAGARFERAAALSEEGKHAEAATEFNAIAAEAPSGYRVLARLRGAAALSETDANAAVAAYDAISADTSVDQALRDAAALRAGILLVDTAPFDEVRRRLEPLAEPGRTFRHTAREMLALSAWRNNDATAARRYIDMVSGDAETPSGTRSRVEVLSALVAAKAGELTVHGLCKCAVVSVTLLGIAGLLTGCANFDPESLDVFGLSNKQKLPGERRPVFPEGVPGVTQGVPPELVKGRQPPPGAETTLADPAPPAEPPPKVQSKPKPKPRVAARPARLTVSPSQQKPAAETQQQSGATAASPPPAQQSQQTGANAPWPAPTAQQPASSPWPSAPAPGTFQR